MLKYLFTLADTIKKIAGDDHSPLIPTITLKAISQAIKDLENIHCKKTDTVAKCKTKRPSTNANYAYVAGTANQLGDGDKTINGVVDSNKHPSNWLVWNDRCHKKVYFCVIVRRQRVPQME